jgi:hypothetical protein
MVVAKSVGCALRLMAISALVVCTASSQVAIQQQDVLKIFTPGGQHFYTPGEPGMFDIGKPGGPHLYDFSSISLSNPSISYNYEVSTIPLLAPRYQAGGVTMGDTPSTIEKNPVFLFNTDTMYVLGHATLSPEESFSHYTPWELVAPFPIVYGASLLQTVEKRETTYTSGNQVQSFDVSSSEEFTTVDGYGTLRLANGEYECLRIKKEHRGYGDKEFLYLTREGVFLGVGGIALADPDTGSVEGGMQILLAASLVDVSEPPTTPVTFALGQNYPNPFNPSTDISFQLPASSHVQLVVFDLFGRQVALLVDEVREQGDNEVRFVADGLSSGVYFYRLTAGTYVQTKKMVLMR